MWDICAEARRRGATGGGELIVRLVRCNGYIHWVRQLGIKSNLQEKEYELDLTKRAALMLAFSEPSPLALLYDTCLAEHKENTVVQFVLGEIWNHYTLPHILEQAKSVLFPPTQLIPGRLCNMPELDRDLIVDALETAVHCPWQCGAYCPFTRIMMSLAKWAGINFVPISRETDSIGVVCIGQYRMGTTVRGKALLALLLALWGSSNSSHTMPAPIMRLISLLEIQN